MAQPKQSRGKSESSWLAARRCLAILRRLQQGAAKKEELLAAVYAAEGADAYGFASGKALNRRFEQDKIRLRDQLRTLVYYDRQAGGYVIKEAELPLLNLSDEEITTLALLADTFQADSPHSGHVQGLIERLVSWLPAERQKLFRYAAGQQPTADLRLRDSDDISPDVWEAVVEAWQAKQELRFDYRSSQQDDGLLREHHIQPWDLYFTDRGHWRLRGYCLFNDGPNGPWCPNDYFPYRVSRIVPGSAKVLPRKLPPMRPKGKPRLVVFELSPQIARFGVSVRKELISEPKVQEMDGGWVRVEGETLDIFELARNLLYYGANCRVLGGRELLQETQELVAKLSAIYQ